MEEMFILDEVKQIVQTLEIKKFSINIMEMRLGVSAIFMIFFYNEKGHTIRTSHYKIEGDEYKAWGANDDYVYELIKTKIDQLIVD